jgi:hypothetical protein
MEGAMDRDSMERLRLDRRLIRRRGWMAKEDLDRELAELPDVSDKIAPREEREATSSESPEAQTPPGGTPLATPAD